MKKIILILLFFIACKESTESTPKADIALSGTLQPFVTTYECPGFKGIVINRGTATGYNCMVEITCYGQDIIIDVHYHVLTIFLKNQLILL